MEEALKKFQSDLVSTIASKFTSQPRASNFTKQQQQLLNTMPNHPTLIVIRLKKNLGQCTIERSKHKKIVHEYLSDANTYVQLTKSKATMTLSNLVTDFFEMLTNTREEYDMRL